MAAIVSSSSGSGRSLLVVAQHQQGGSARRENHRLMSSSLISSGRSSKSEGRRRCLLFLVVISGAGGRQSSASQQLPDARSAAAAADTSVTDKVYLDLSSCERPTSCSGGSGEYLGRLVIGLYGKQVPTTVSNFKAMCIGGGFRGTLIHKVIRGRYIQAGRQGYREGDVSPPGASLLQLRPNTESISPSAFSLRHTRPGTVSLCLSQNDDDDRVKLDTDYRNVEFMITTGPGPAPDLDNGNIVFGTVLQGMDVVASITMRPTVKPSERVRELNGFAEILGDDRAANARRNAWDRPVKPIVITDCGQLS